MSRQPLRVVFVLPDLTGGGAERVTLTLLRHLDRTVVAPALFLFRREGDYLDDVPSDVPLYSGGEANAYRSLVGGVRRLLEVARGADVLVGALELKSILAVVCASMVTGRPALGWIHKNLDCYFASVGRFRALAYKTLIRLSFRRLNGVVAVSAGVAQALRGHFPALNPRVSVIYNPLDIQDIRRQAARPLPDWFAPLHGRPVVLAVGRLARQKNLELLLRAHAELIGRGLQHHLVILGEGPERRSLNLLVDELGIGDTVHMPGFGNPYPVMRTSRLYVLSSHYEGLPTVMMEAQCLGLPIVATDCPSGPAEILDGGACGVLVPPEDATALADAIAFALDNPEDMTNLARAGLIHADTYAIGTVCLSWQGLLLRAAGPD